MACILLELGIHDYNMQSDIQQRKKGFSKQNN